MPVKDEAVTESLRAFVEQIARLSTDAESQSVDGDDAAYTLDKIIYKARDLTGHEAAMKRRCAGCGAQENTVLTSSSPYIRLCIDCVNKVM